MIIESGRADTALWLSLTIVLSGTGGVAGQSPTVALRVPGTAHYLDFADYAIKPSGWTLRDAPLVDMGDGRYDYQINPSRIPTGVDAMIVEYNNADASHVVGGADSDVLLLRNLPHDVAIVRKSVTNRMEEAPGNPGTIVLYDDDAMTVILTQTLRDDTGGQVLPSKGEPAKRSGPQ